MDFTPNQLAALRYTGMDTCVVAGPGSGKTTVLVEYFQRLVESGMDPLRILAITFTEKAAGNMREKLAQVFRSRPEIRGKLERAYVSTVDGFCARLLRENAVFAGVDPEFRILDERESARFQAQAISQAMDRLYAEDPESIRSLMRGLGSSDIESAVPDVYNALRAAGIGVAELSAYRPGSRVELSGLASALEALRREKPARWSADQEKHLKEILVAGARIVESPDKLAAIAGFDCKLTKLKKNNHTYDLVRRIARELVPELEYTLITEHYAPQRGALCSIFIHFDQLYRELKLPAGGLDYGDLEEFAVRLLAENREVRRRVQFQFDQILMDEFQDTNDQQARLLELLRPPDCFYAVGDINQSIYGFRHADPEVFRAYRDAVAKDGKHVVELVENFRSRPAILRAVEMILHGAPGIEPRPLVAARKFPEKTEPSVEVIAALGEQAQTLETQWVAHRILEFASGGAEFQDMAVLVRNSEVLGDFTKAFDDFGIPYLVNRGKGFYENREITDLTHFLRILVNARDEISMAAVLRSPFVQLSDEGLLRLRQFGNLGSGLRRIEPAGFDPGDWGKLQRFRQQLERWRAIRDYVSFDRLILGALDETGYECESGARGAANIEKFLAQARAAGPRQSLAEFVEELKRLRDSNPREPDAPPEDSANAVKIMTVHAAKGLEFPIVFLAALHKGVDSGVGALAFSPRVGLGARWRNPATGKDKSDLFLRDIREERKQADNSESYRLFYVAMTRAEQHLVLSLAHAGGKLQHWAAVLQAGLGLDLQSPRDDTVILGGDLPVRVLCTSAPPARTRAEPSPDRSAGVQIVSRPVITDQHDSNANVTDVAMFANCPRRYYLSRYLGWEGRAAMPEEPADSDGVSATDLGSQVHAILAGATAPSPYPEALELAQTFCKSSLGRRAARAAEIEREFDFLLAIDDVVLRGRIDLWFVENGEMVLVDYKTDAVSAADAPRHAQTYAMQLRLYALALQRLTDRAPDRAYICLLKPDVAVPVDLSPSLIESPEAIIHDFREAQSSLSFPLNEGARCRSCPYYHGLCPSVFA